MPQRARDRSALHDAHPVLHYRDDRAISLARQKIEHPKDRRRGRAQACHCTYCDGYSGMPNDEFRRARGGRPLQLRPDDTRVHTADGGRESWPEREKPAPGLTVNLWELAKPGRVRRDVPKGFELVQRPREVIALDDQEESEWEDDFEIVERPAQKRGKGKGGSFAQAVKGKRRER